MEVTSYPNGVNPSPNPSDLIPLWGSYADTGDNGTVWKSALDNNTSYQQQQQLMWNEMVRASLNHVVIPIVCLIGIIGNAFNFYVFYCRWYQKFMNDAEKSVTVGLMSLALSDAMFCLAALPSLFLYTMRPGSSTLHVLTQHYNAYKPFFLNMFIFNSTWLIAAIALQRVVALSLNRDRCCLTNARKTALIHLGIFLVSFVVCVPLLLRYRIMTSQCLDNSICYYFEASGPLTSAPFKTAYKVFWMVFGTIFPLVILATSNIRLLLILNHDRFSERGGTTDRSGSRKITVLVIAMVLSFLLLVCPSMVVDCLSWILLKPQGEPGQSEVRPSTLDIQRISLAISITNLLQAIKFSFNFLLYCTVNRQFRRELRSCKVNDSCRLSKVDREATANLRLDQLH